MFRAARRGSKVIKLEYHSSKGPQADDTRVAFRVLDQMSRSNFVGHFVYKSEDRVFSDHDGLVVFHGAEPML